MKKRLFLIVLDSLGVGELPDATDYGDAGSNTLYGISRSSQFLVPHLEQLGLFAIDGVKDLFPAEAARTAPIATYARMTEKSKGKDTTIGHWEISGIISEQPMPTYPAGFPEEILHEFEKQTGHGILCNRPYSGTDVIRDYGEEHMKTKSLIVYTSADSVFQIAAHEEVIPIEELYHYCRIARKILTGQHGVGRVIARPFIGDPGKFKRTGNRHDFSLEPPRKTMLNYLNNAGYDVISIGKINDIFAGSGITKVVPSKSNEEGITGLYEMLETEFNGLCFLNLVDFDMLYGHRNDVDGYAKALSVFDEALVHIKERMQPEDVLMITADHGCDPSTPSTDHSREYTPLLVYGSGIRPVNLGTRATFADISAGILEYFHVSGIVDGIGFMPEILK